MDLVLAVGMPRPPLMEHLKLVHRAMPSQVPTQLAALCILQSTDQLLAFMDQQHRAEFLHHLLCCILTSYTTPYNMVRSSKKLFLNYVNNS